jgi:sugar lactone lactonase YvrE
VPLARPKRPAIQPVTWHPPAPTPGARRGTRPFPCLRLLELNATGPEDVLVDAVGRVLTGVEDGRILRVSADGDRVDTLADTGGRPLGLELMPDGMVLVCDAHRGLLRLDPVSGRVEVLADRAGGSALRFCNNAAVAADGTVYFTDSSRRFGIQHWKADLLEHSGTGRLLRRSPEGQVEVLVEGLQFANGVALAADGSFVVVAETGAYRLRRLWLTGPRTGQLEVLVDNLPGFPDNIATGTDGLVWIALASPRNAALDLLHPLHPALRRAVWALPERWQPAPKPVVWVRAVEPSGRVVHNLCGTHERFRFVTGVREFRGRVYLGSLYGNAVAVLDLATTGSST